MSRIDIGQCITNPKVVPATAKGFYKAADSEKTGRICAELEDALEQVRRGEISKDEYKTIKADRKKGCKFYTPHAHFKKGYKRRDGGPWDSGKAVIDLDGCEHFEQLYEERLKGREKELGINMANISVSKTGGHILFDIPEGLNRQQAQAWMAGEVLGGVAYDKAVHERERAVYIPCRHYILYLDEELMFSDQLHPAKLSEEELLRYKRGVKMEVKKEVKKEVKEEVKMEVKMGVKVDDTTEANERIRFIAQGVMKEKQLQESDFLLVMPDNSSFYFGVRDDMLYVTPSATLALEACHQTVPTDGFERDGANGRQFFVTADASRTLPILSSFLKTFARR